MIDYYETKSQPITRLEVWKAYWKVRKNKGGTNRSGPPFGGLRMFTRNNRIFFPTGSWYIHKMYIVVIEHEEPDELRGSRPVL
jgi:hypothetical protein